MRLESIAANLGICTDLLLHAQTGIVQQQDGYVVVRTPDAPEYYFGNMLVLKRRPSESERARLEADFRDLVGAPPLIKHRTFVWPDSEEGIVGLDAYIEAGYDATHCCVLVAGPADLHVAATNPSVEVRPFFDQSDWDCWTEMHLADNAEALADGSFVRYLAHQQSSYQQLISKGLGDWWGAYIDGEQVGSLGLFEFEGVARFQSVITAEAHRNKNVCRTLLHEVASRAFARGVKKLVIVADESYHAGRIYEGMGFRRTQWVSSLCQEPHAAAEGRGKAPGGTR
jgi:GNAT superfamily N-acetyltransferase